MDSNHRRYKPADLQSAPFGHSGIRPIANAKLTINFESAKYFSLLRFNAESTGKCKINLFFDRTRFLGLKNLVFFAVFH